MKGIFLLGHFFCILFLFSCKKEKEAKNEVTIYKASGDISTEINRFRNSVGNLNTTPGAVGGRREINWDGVPDSMLNKALPTDFFNTVGNNIPASRQRGLVYDDGEFQVSATNFVHLNNEAATEFSSFSGNKSFANISRLDWPVGFRVAGETTPATVTAFGMVFSDVDLEGSVALAFFDGEKSLGKFFVPPHDANSSFSFLGVKFYNSKITKVKVSHQGKLSDGQKDISQGGVADLVVVDDLIYSEPVKQ
ncbi:MAG TPA: hypothetical protein VEY10_14720 [Flavisolibacter sp.]|nr:hypothetical protein [Flavisolibacter sp.]